ncbi:MAG: F-type H+-transporting ATPase subunit [Geobacteraceae bacterium]|nr:MAG: F-type H+-transporting ATPase subunit [Geobacteraceae bacterium]
MKQFVRKIGWTKPVTITAAVCFLLVMLAAAGWAAEGGEGAHHVDTGKQLKDFGWRVLDFAVLVAIAVWALKKANVKGVLADRQAGIAKALKDAVEARESAERKYAEYSDKLAKANKEIDEIQAAIRQEGEAEKARIIAEAKVTAEKIREQAKLAAGQEVVKARAELREEAARLAVQLAEQTLKEKIRKDDQDRLVGEYLTKVVELH